jgi:predicted O-methyltransferase YrrM
MPRSSQDLVIAKQQFFTNVHPYIYRCTVLQKESAPGSVIVREFDKLDFCFIDACHLYESVLEDIDTWYPLVRDGGVVSGHDYQSAGDRRGLFGVKRAVDEWCLAHNYTVNVSLGSVWWFIK